MSKINIQALLVLLLAVACFFGGIRFERERRRREVEANLKARLRLIFTVPYRVSGRP
jgi:hypothetical protein